MDVRGVSRFVAAIFLLGSAGAIAQTDPGVRPGANGAGDHLQGLSPNEIIFFDAGREVRVLRGLELDSRRKRTRPKPMSEELAFDALSARAAAA